MFKKSLARLMIMCMMVLPVLTYAGQAVAAEAKEKKDKEMGIKIMSYNIHHAEGKDGVLDLQRIADIIAKSGADIIGLQEVDNHWSDRSSFEDQAKWLADRLHLHYAYAANLDLEPLEEGQARRQYGTAVFSKFPILHAENHLLTNIPYTEKPSEQRGLLETVINVKGKHIRFYNTHLDNRRAEQRDLQIKEILAIAGKKEGTSIFVGDFNAKPGSAEILKITAQYKDVFAELGQNDTFTIPSSYVDPITGAVSKPDSRIDYVFTTDDVQFRAADVIDSIASDHIAVTADLLVTK
ncbi:endonuclease/exonuclease/phosphatase family protein [Paenibacillus solisilvae]|uniref:Endonuclease/exonuclease/phosphatase family protein n=1 Tax=Paenibacillus solisilvae TaxID=2486751 RepID=A0ABW0VWY5_9BACL